MTKDEYEELNRAASAKRCVNCEHNNNGECKYYGTIPESHRYAETDCEKWSFDIPF